MIMTRFSSRESSSKDYCSLLGTLCEHLGVTTRLQLCRSWRITPHPRRICKKEHAQVSTQLCIGITAQVGVGDAAVVSSTKSTPIFVGRESTDDLDNLSNCRGCLAQSHRASKCPLLPQNLCINGI